MKIISWNALQAIKFNHQDYEKYTGTGVLVLKLVKLAYSKRTGGHVWLYGVDEYASKYSVYFKAFKLTKMFAQETFKNIEITFLNGIVKDAKIW